MLDHLASQGQAVVAWGVIVTLAALSSAAANFVTLLRRNGANSLQRRVDCLEAQLRRVDEVMRAEDEATRQELRQSFQEVQRALGRIEGQLALLTQRIARQDEREH